MAVARTKQKSRTSRSISRTTRGLSTEHTLVSDEPHDVKYLHKRFPKSTQATIRLALEECKLEVKSDDRKEIMNCLKKKLGPPRDSISARRR
jgi:hypothetical protein